MRIAILLLILLLPPIASAQRVLIGHPHPGQTEQFERGRQFLVSQGRETVVTLSPGSKDNKQGEIVITVVNMADRAIDLNPDAITAARDGKQQLRLFSKADVERKERRRRFWEGLAAGLVAGANIYAAAQSGYSTQYTQTTGTITAYGPGGPTSGTYSGLGVTTTYDPVAQQRAFDQAGATSTKLFQALRAEQEARAGTATAGMLERMVIPPGAFATGRILMALPRQRRGRAERAEIQVRVADDIHMFSLFVDGQANADQRAALAVAFPASEAPTPAITKPAAQVIVNAIPAVDAAMPKATPPTAPTTTASVATSASVSAPKAVSRSSPLKTASESTVTFPSYGDTVLPITAPFQVRYAPHVARLATSLNAECSASGTTEHASLGLSYVQRVERQAPGLGWRLDHLAVNIQGMTSPTTFSVRWVTDLQGHRNGPIDFMEVDPNASSDAPSSWERVANPSSFFDQFSKPLPTGLFVTGSQFDELSFANELGVSDRAKSWLSEIPHSVPSKVLGWGQAGGRQVLVVEHAYSATSATIPSAESDLNLNSIAWGGFTLYDAATMVPLHRDVAGHATMNSSGETGTCRFVVTTDAELMLTDAEVAKTHKQARAIAVTPKLVRMTIEFAKHPFSEARPVAFFDIDWTIIRDQDIGAIEGRLILVDAIGRERVALPWSISSEDAMHSLFQERGSGFELASFGRAREWIRTAKQSDISLKFEPDPAR